MYDRNNILGAAGTGMNYLAKMIIIEKVMQGNEIKIIDPEREYKALYNQLLLSNS